MQMTFLNFKVTFPFSRPTEVCPFGQHGGRLFLLFEQIKKSPKQDNKKTSNKIKKKTNKILNVVFYSVLSSISRANQLTFFLRTNERF